MGRQTFGQDRQDPTMLSRVFLAGAASGASCALLQTPVRPSSIVPPLASTDRTQRQIEVVKCRAQAESIGVDGKKTKMGSFKIAQMIAKKDGLRGFYIGGLMTACRDGISSGIFFWGCTSFFLSCSDLKEAKWIWVRFRISSIVERTRTFSADMEDTGQGGIKRCTVDTADIGNHY